jgi:hypothetical protein
MTSFTLNESSLVMTTRRIAYSRLASSGLSSSASAGLPFPFTAQTTFDA